MSSKYVRDEFRDSWSTKVPSIPLHETLNDDPDHSDMEDLWATVEFVAFNEQPISLGSPSCRRETGTIIVVLMSRAGQGDEDLLTAAETVRTAYRHWSETDLNITQIDPPLSDRGFSDGMWYTMSIDISYVYDRYI